LVAALAIGCSASTSTTDDTAFRAAIGQYLLANNMAMKIKEVKEGPTISGDAATLKASMTHEKLGGPSVTWEFHFTKQSDGSWEVIRRD